MAIVIEKNTKYRGLTFIQETEPPDRDLCDLWHSTTGNIKVWNGIGWTYLKRSGQAYGFVLGGRNNNEISTIERLLFPFSSGMASVVGNLSQSKYGPTGCNSSEYGYVMGGYNTSIYFSTIDKIQFPFDSGSPSFVGNLSQSKRLCEGCNSSSHGYIMGDIPKVIFLQLIE